jgi:hypothetical protein
MRGVHWRWGCQQGRLGAGATWATEQGPQIFGAPKILISSDYKNGLLSIRGLFFLIPRLDPLLEHHKSISSFFLFSLFIHG